MPLNFYRYDLAMVLDQNKNSHEVVLNENIAIGGNAKTNNTRINIYIDIAFISAMALLAFVIIKKIINAHKTYVQKRIANTMSMQNINA